MFFFPNLTACQRPSNLNEKPPLKSRECVRGVVPTRQVHPDSKATLISAVGLPKGHVSNDGLEAQSGW